MRFLSIDIETTGLDEEYCQVLEIGAVLGDLTNTPVDNLPYTRLRLCYEKLVGQPVALAMNAKLIADMDRRAGPYPYIYPDQAWSYFSEWLECSVPGFWGTKLTVAGKNYGTFDRRFLAKLPRWHTERFHHRTIDPAVLFWHPATDEVLPDTQECIRRAGLSWDLGSLHSALDDARLVVELVRAGIGYKKGDN